MYALCLITDIGSKGNQRFKDQCSENGKPAPHFPGFHGNQGTRLHICHNNTWWGAKREIRIDGETERSGRKGKEKGGQSKLT